MTFLTPGVTALLKYGVVAVLGGVAAETDEDWAAANELAVAASVALVRLKPSG